MADKRKILMQPRKRGNSRLSVVTLTIWNCIAIIALSSSHRSGFFGGYCNASKSSSLSPPSSSSRIRTTKHTSASKFNQKKRKTNLKNASKPNTRTKTSTTTTTTTTVHKPNERTGTHMTGAGSHSNRNKSIFSSPESEFRKGAFAALIGPAALIDDENNGGGTTVSSTSEKTRGTTTTNPTMYAKLTEDKGLLLFFPKSTSATTDQHPNEERGMMEEKEAIELKNGEIIALSTDWTPFQSGDGTITYEPSMRVEPYTIHDYHSGSSTASPKERSVRGIFKTSKNHNNNYNGASSITTATNVSNITSGWIPLEGIYGIHFLPSGPHLVLITESDAVYTTQLRKGGATAGNATDSPSCAPSSSVLLDIRRVRSMEIVALPSSQSWEEAEGTKVPEAFVWRQKRAEERQLGLLRHSFKEHDFYFVPRTFGRRGWPLTRLGDGGDDNVDVDGGVVVRDMTHTLQRVFLHGATLKEQRQMEAEDALHSSSKDEELNKTKYEESLTQIHDEHTKSLSHNQHNKTLQHKSNNSTTSFDLNDHKNSWWFPLLAPSDLQHKYPKPDSRFFWNEEAVQPFLETIKNAQVPHANNNQTSLFCTLANHIVPVTSAFVGVQRDIPLAPPDSSNSNNNNNNAVYSVFYDQILISRRSKYRAGTRFTRRGSDDLGDVANYAESEQICFVLDNHEPKNDDGKVVVPNDNSIVSNNQRRTGGGGIREIYAHVQTRGSIPLRWSSPADVKTYAPRVLIGSDPEAQARSLRSHLLDQLSVNNVVERQHGPNERVGSGRGEDRLKLLFVNLIDKKHDQGRLGRTFDAVLNAVLDVYSKTSSKNDVSVKAATQQFNHKSMSDLLHHDCIKHIWFDFHAECKGGKWGKLGKLLEDVTPVLDQQGYFCAISQETEQSSTAPSWKMLRVQDGAVRTNCMDCLDRTNVVQSLFGRYIIYQHFKERIGWKHGKSVRSFGSSPSPASEIVSGRSIPIEYIIGFKKQPMMLPWKRGEVSHRLLWADNADTISKLYAGTPALKGDFTRTGKRTKRGALDDGVNSLQRYYLNNFLDADRQEGMDLLVGFAKFDAIQGGNQDTHNEIGLDRLANGFDKPGLLRGGRVRSYKKRVLPTSNESKLDLSWLPGDLQSQLRGAALMVEPHVSAMSSTFGTMDVSEFSVAKALKEIDRRASLEQPWWVIEDDSYEYENNATNKNNPIGNKVRQGASSLRETLTTSASGGHILGSLIAINQAPIATAITIICVMAPGILINGSIDDSMKD